MAYPYNNDYMTYDYDTHKYILTEKCVLDKLNVNLATILNQTDSANVQNIAPVLLRRISNLVYNYIYSFTQQNDVQEYLIAKKPSARPMIMEAMLEQVVYFIINGDISAYSGVDFKKSSVGPNAYGRIIAPETQALLSRPLNETGVPITYAGKYPYVFKFDYEKENY